MSCLLCAQPADFQCVNCAEPMCVLHSFDHTHVAHQSRTTTTVLQQRLCAFCNDVNQIIDDEWKMVQLMFVLNILILPIPCVCYYAMTCADRVKKKVEEYNKTHFPRKPIKVTRGEHAFFLYPASHFQAPQPQFMSHHETTAKEDSTDKRPLLSPADTVPKYS